MRSTTIRTRLATAAALSSVLALAASQPASATLTTCYADLPGPAGQSWQIKANGSMQTRLAIGEDRAWAADHGTLKIGGTAYPTIPNDPLACDRTGNTLTFPKRTFGDFEVSRSVSVTADGRLRHIDTVRNTSAGLEIVDLDFNMEITGAQVGFESENGDAIAGDNEEWFVLKDDAVFPVIQWGTDGGAVTDEGREAPAVVNPDETEDWAPDFDNGDESARLDYHADLAPGETVRFMHLTGARNDGAAAAIAMAKDGAGAFGGLSQAVAKTVINWGPDSDKDGVSAHNDACPAIKGQLANGCNPIIAQPVDPGQGGEDVPAGDQSPAPAPAPAGDTSQTPAPTQPVADRRAPKVDFGKLVKRIRRGTLATRGLRPAVRCDEGCALELRVEVRRRGAKKAIRVAKATRKSFSTKAFAPKLKLSGKQLGRLSRSRITLVVVARDGAGNVTKTSRNVTLRK